MNAKTCKLLRREANRIAQQVYVQGKGRGGPQPHYKQRTYKEIHHKEAQVNPDMGKPFLTRDTAEPIVLDVVLRQPQPVRLSDGTPRLLYRQLKKLHRRAA